MRNIPSVTLGLVAVSRDCFPVTLSESRRARVAAACRALALPFVWKRSGMPCERWKISAPMASTPCAFT